MSSMATISWSEIPAGEDPRELLAPGTWPAFCALHEAACAAGPADLLALSQARIEMLLCQPSAAASPPPGPAGKRAEVARWATSGAFDARERAALSFTEQFVLDVAGITPDHRALLFGALSESEVGPFVMGLFTCDYGLRTTEACNRVFGSSLRAPTLTGADPKAAAELGDRFNALLRAIALLDGLDPITTELVRLRGARSHNCRICQSIRSVKALEQGADEATFDKVDRYQHSDLPDRHKAALALTDRIVTQPTEIDHQLVGELQAHYSPQEVVEIILDVLRNSSQKVAVAMEGDAPNVAEGVEYYAIDEQGDVLFGQAAPV